MPTTHFAIAVLALAGYTAGQGVPDSLLRASEAEQIAAVTSALDQGFPPGPSAYLTTLIFYRSSLVLPLMEKKIEQVLGSASPRDTFSDKTVDPQKFVDHVAWIIADTGDEAALAEIAKLTKVDKDRFGSLVGIALSHSTRWHNPFVVAYSGLAIADPLVQKLILSWAEKNLSVDPEERARAEAAARGLGPTPPPPAEKMKHLWAEAMLARYGAPPTDAQWASDPIASGLSAPLAESLYGDLPRFAWEALQKRAPK